jgi:hypothetical protein
MLCEVLRRWHAACTGCLIGDAFERGESQVGDDHDAQRRAHLRRALILHLRRYPLAGDTAEGIVSCWLPPQGCYDAPAFINDVVKTMLAAGELASRSLPDGRVYYTRGPALSTP